MLGWGVIGIGSIVQTTIAPAMVAEPQCDLVAATSRDQGRADQFAESFGAKYAYTDYAKMLANPEVEAVFIATPNGLHAEQAIAAARAGKHVLCDKPLAINVDDARNVVSACAAAGIKLGVNFHYRQLPWVQDVTNMIRGGVVGDVRVIQMEVSSGPRHYDNWRADQAMAGLGSVHNVGVHALDLLRVILGSEPVEVTAMFDQPARSGSVEMLGLLLIRFENGTLVYCNFNESLAYPVNDIRIYGSKGRISGAGITRSRVDGDLVVLTEDGETVTRYVAPEAHRMAVAAFTNSILAGESPIPSGEDGLRSAQLCRAIARSVETRRVVEVDYSPNGH